MTERGRREYAEVMRRRYQDVTRRQRGGILEEYCRVTRCHRKGALCRLRETLGNFLADSVVLEEKRPQHLSHCYPLLNCLTFDPPM